MLSACTKTLPMDSILVSYSNMISTKPPDSYCYFKDLTSDNFTVSEDEENCWEGININRQECFAIENSFFPIIL